VLPVLYRWFEPPIVPAEAQSQAVGADGK